MAKHRKTNLPVNIITLLHSLLKVLSVLFQVGLYKKKKKKCELNNYVNNVMAGLKSSIHSCWINRLSPITLLQTFCIYLVYSVSVSASQLFVVTCI